MGRSGSRSTWRRGSSACFGGLALALAAVGLYSVVSYTVAQRTNEFGIRMALGAQRDHVMRIVFASTLVSVGSGIVIGLALTFALNKMILQWAQGNSNDPAILLGGDTGSCSGGRESPVRCRLCGLRVLSL